MVVLAESSLLGVILGLVAFGTQRVVDRRRQVTSYPDRSGSMKVVPPPNSTAEYTPVGSDDSTAVRVRPGSSRGRLVIDPESATPLTEESP